jgi:hypothetical protein
VTDVAALIADMVRAGVDPELIGRAAEALSQREAVLVPDEAANRRRQRDRERKRLRNSAEVGGLRGNDEPLSSEVPPAPLPNSKPEVPPSPPKGGSSPADEIAVALEAYCAMAETAGLSKPRDITDARRTRLKAVLREHGMPVWLEAVQRVGASSFCRGENDRGWRADLDFLLQPKSFPKILEGFYDNRPRAGPANGNPIRGPSVFFAAADYLDENGRSDEGDTSDRHDAGGVPVLALEHRPRDR